MYPVVGDVHPLSDVVVGEAGLGPIEQLQDLGQRQPVPGERRVREESEPLTAPLTPPSAGGRRPGARTSASARTPGTGFAPRSGLHETEFRLM